MERFYGDKCVNYGVLKENSAKTCRHTSQNTGFGGFCGKNAADHATCRLDSFSGRRRGYLKFPSLGGPHTGEKIKKHPLEGSQGRGNRGPGGPGLRMDGFQAF